MRSYKTRLSINYVSLSKRLELQLERDLSLLDFITLKIVIKNGLNELSSCVSERHCNKLNQLNISPPSFGNPDLVIKNFSTYILSQREKQLLTLGLDFTLPGTKYNYFKYFLSFEKLASTIKQKTIFNSNFKKYVVRLRI